MNSRVVDHISHDALPAALRETPSCLVSSLRHNQNFQLWVSSALSLLRMRKWGVVPCTEQHCRNTRIPPAKSSGQLVGSRSLTQRSNPSSPTSPTRFGLRTLRLRSPRFVDAAFAPLNAISADNENGPVTQSPPSLPKFCVATKFATSRSSRENHYNSPASQRF